MSEQETPEVQEETTEEIQTEELSEVQLNFSEEDLPIIIEALLFVSGTPLSAKRLASVTKSSEEQVTVALNILKERLVERESAIELVEVNQEFQFRTKEVFASFIKEFKKKRPRKLSPAALETLAVIAYRQPVVKSDIEAIRGVDVAPTLKTLLDRKLVRIAGYQASVGQPALYGTTEAFLEIFGLSSIKDLPTLRDLQELEEEPGEGGEELIEEELEVESQEEQSIEPAAANS